MASQGRSSEDASSHNDTQDDTKSFKPRLVGTTYGHHEEEIVHHTPRSTRESILYPKSPNYFKSLAWSGDGTSILASSADNALCSFILPPTLLDPQDPQPLKPYTKHQLPEPAYATAFYPSYSLNDPSTCLFIASPRDLPVRLYSTLGGGVLGSYPLVSPTTEAYVTPHSLLFPSSDGNEFIAGSDGAIAVFDISRPGEGPVTVMRTKNKRQYRWSNKIVPIMEAADELTGIISALNVSCDGVLAAGTFGRKVGLYDNHGYGETNAVFSLVDNSDPETRGCGITEVLWDESGRYLCVVERSSDGVSIWDIRGTGKRLAWLRGRKAKTTQRMGCALMGGELWAGGTDGVVRVWRDVGMREGMVERDWEFDAHGDVVSGIGLHPTGSVVATCSGQRSRPRPDPQKIDGEEDSDMEPDIVQSHTIDNSLKVWAV